MGIKPNDKRNAVLINEYYEKKVCLSICAQAQNVNVYKMIIEIGTNIRYWNILKSGEDSLKSIFYSRLQFLLNCLCKNFAISLHICRPLKQLWRKKKKDFRKLFEDHWDDC